MTPQLFYVPRGALVPDVSNTTRGLCDVGDGFVWSLRPSSGGNLTLTKVGYDGFVKWQKAYPSTDGNVGVLASGAGGEFFVLGYKSILKVDGNGSVIWEKWSTVEAGNFDGGWIGYPPSEVGCLYVLPSNNTANITRITADGVTAARWLYTGIANEAALYGTTLHECADGTFLLPSWVGDTNNYLRVSRLSSTFGSITATKSLKITGSDASWSLVQWCSVGTSIILAFTVGAPAAELRLVCLAEDLTVTWSKELTDADIADFGANWAYMYPCQCGPSDTDYGVTLSSWSDTDPWPATLYRIKNDGTLLWSRTLQDDASPEHQIGLSDGSIVFSSTVLVDGVYHRTAVTLRADGTPASTFGTTAYSVAARTGVSLVSGDTIVVADDTAGSIASVTTTTTAQTLGLLSSSHPVISVYPDNFQQKSASGTKEVFHGTANSPYLQAGVAAGSVETNHGNATSFVGMPAGATICTASGTKEVFHGAATGASPVIGTATGKLSAFHSTANSLASYAATGKLSAAHGTAKGAVAGRASGASNTKYGTPVGLTVGVASGVFNTRYGIASSAFWSLGTATGHQSGAYGTPSSLSVFRATGSFKTRYGTAKVIRSIPC